MGPQEGNKRTTTLQLMKLMRQSEGEVVRDWNESWASASKDVLLSKRLVSLPACGHPSGYDHRDDVTA
jgi:hypothetical protein